MSWLKLAAAAAIAALAVSGSLGGPLQQGAAAAGRISACGWRNQTTCVVDGDTVHWRGAKIRIADIDTPEIHEPRCASEAELGRRAKSRLVELLNQGPFEIVRIGGRDIDRYGRRLRLLRRDGNSIGAILVAEGLARRWQGHKRDWCLTAVIPRLRPFKTKSRR